jgi:asparagine N-glycosylation enzyme membrane subunit Stt3
MAAYPFLDFKLSLMKKRTTSLRILDFLAILLCIATFSPLVIPENEASPYLFGIPYSMWMGFLVSILFIVLAYFVSRVNKEKNHAD